MRVESLLSALGRKPGKPDIRPRDSGPAGYLGTAVRPLSPPLDPPDDPPLDPPLLELPPPPEELLELLESPAV